MGLLDKFKRKDKDDKADAAMRDMKDFVNKYGGDMRVYKCPNRCLDYYMDDWTDVPGPHPHSGRRCPKCGSKLIPM